MHVILQKDVEKAIHQHALATYNNECCGFLYGTDATINRIVCLSRPVNNIHKGGQKRRYQISSLDYMKAEQCAVERNLTLLGVYHSHPDHPARPSEYDTQHALPFFSYIIISVMNGEIKKKTSWRLNDQREFIEEILSVKPKSTYKITQNKEAHYG